MKRSHIYSVLFGTAMIVGTGTATLAQDNVTAATAAAAKKTTPATVSNRPLIPRLPAPAPAPPAEKSPSSKVSIVDEPRYNGVIYTVGNRPFIPPVAPPPPETPATTTTGATGTTGSKISIVEQLPYNGVIYSPSNRLNLSVPQSVPAKPMANPAPATVERTGAMVEMPKAPAVEASVPNHDTVWTPAQPAVANDRHEDVPAVNPTPREEMKQHPSGNVRVNIDNVPASDALVSAHQHQTSMTAANGHPAKYNRTGDSMAARYRAEAAAAIPEGFKDPAHLYAAQAALQMRDVENGSRNALMADLGAYVKAQGAANQAINCGNGPQTASIADRSDASLEAELMRLMFTKAECGNHAQYLAERRDALSRELRRRHEAREAEARRNAEAARDGLPTEAPRVGGDRSARNLRDESGNGTAPAPQPAPPAPAPTAPAPTPAPAPAAPANGTKTHTDPDGTQFITDGNGGMTIVHTDGSTYVEKHGHSTFTYPDGYRITTYPDGRQTTFSPRTGKIEVRNPDGENGFTQDANGNRTPLPSGSYPNGIIPIQ